MLEWHEYACPTGMGLCKAENRDYSSTLILFEDGCYVEWHKVRMPHWHTCSTGRML